MNRLIRKPLGEDCLLDGQLHPSIIERLQRIRELPVAGAANFHGVEGDDGGLFLLWEFVPGKSLEEFLAQPHTQQERERVARELTRAVASLHAQGIVHGALHSRNVIIDQRGRVCLTHISPLLWSDAAQDARSMDQLLLQLKVAGADDDAASTDSDPMERRARLIAYMWSIVVALCGVAIFFGVLWLVRD
ncbi:MAG TPA: protein kinase [Tepidisphaeraceae bacterium]|nr:protein kinase [Tepidisphaeraceae bacterium]